MLAGGGALQSSNASAETSLFVSVIPDLPLMPGLKEDVSLGVVFETSSGRIAEAYASGVGSVRAVGDFYTASLPQLGWHIETRVRYRREGEILSLDIALLPDQPGSVGVGYKLVPASP